MEKKTKTLGCLAAGCGGLIVMTLIFAVGVFMMVLNIIKSSDAYAMAMESAESNPAIVEALGKPIEAGFMIMGSINTDGPGGNANISIPLSGPKGEGTLYAIAEKSAGRWNFSTLEFEGPSGDRVDLMPNADELIEKHKGELAPDPAASRPK